MSTDGGWTFLTNHAHVLVCVARDPDASMRVLAARVGITERAVQRIIADLVDGGYLVRERAGRRNTYLLDTAHPLRHPVERDTRLRDLLAALDAEPPPDRTERAISGGPRRDDEQGRPPPQHAPPL